VYCTFVRSGADTFTCVTSIESSPGGATAASVDPVTPAKTAWTVDVPAATVVARPCEPAALLTRIAVPSDEYHVTRSVRSWPVPSLKTPAGLPRGRRRRHGLRAPG